MNMSGKLVCVADYEKHASQVLPASIFEFYKGGANHEQTLKDNHDAFQRWRLMPRVMRGVSNRSLETTVLGCKISAPLGIAPTAMHKMAHEDGECATAKAAAAQGIIYIMSTLATSSVEEIAAIAPNGHNWFQLCIFKDRNFTANLVRRAERANFKALVLTVDAGMLGRRLASERNGFQLPSNLRLGNYDIPRDEKTLALTLNDGSKFTKGFDSTFDPCLKWTDIDWLKSITNLPIVVKGILRPDDAELAVQHGASAIQVSNHGGRQLDGVQATIDALPAIVKQVNGRCEVYVDGGITQGTDVLKALALGAKMAVVGRPILWGLAHNGQKGVENIVEILKAELDLAMALSGCSSVEDVDSSLILGTERFSKM